MSTKLPVVSLAAPEEEAAQVLRQACIDEGFFYGASHTTDPRHLLSQRERTAALPTAQQPAAPPPSALALAVSDHGVPQQLLDDTLAAQRKFFSLPLEQKMQIAVNKYYRGYTPMAEETLDPARSRRGDTHEGLYFGRHVEEGSEEAKLPLHGPNQWPDEALVPGFRAATEAYWEAAAAVGFRLLRLLGLSLGLGAEFFRPFFTRPMIALRPLHYSGEHSSEADGLYAAGAHTDYGMLTLLATDGVPGLQICTDGATWRGVEPLPGCLIVNLGDMLCRWTNGLYRSTLHRVVNTTGQERYSLPLFYEPNFEALVTALDSCVEEGQAPLFPPITAGQHLLERYHATHAGYGKAAAEQAATAANEPDDH